jgi:outer membrane protein assembly factor BamB
MATLEVHDGQGRVQFVELARDHPVLFGTSASCDVLLDGEGIRPVHGRIRWKKRRFRVEASPDAEFVLINGAKMSTGSIRQGDEIAVGACRIFLLRNDETLDDAASRPQDADDADEGRTKVLTAPVVPVEPERDGGRGGRRGKSRSSTRGESALENEDWLSSLRNDVRVKPVESAPVENLKRGFMKPKLVELAYEDELEPAGPAPSRRFPLVELLKSLRLSQAPGQERIASSPIVLGLLASLVVLVVMGFWLKAIIESTVATRTFKQGIQDYDDGDYRTAMRAFKSFVQTNPDDPRTDKARVFLAMANVRQYISADGGTLSSALEASQQALEKVGGLEEFRDVRADLGEMILRVGEGLADRARTSADRKALSEAESAVSLHSRVAGKPAMAFLNGSKLPGKLSEARAAVRKAEIRMQALAAMDKALGEGSANHVYDARDDLVVQYGDLAHDKDLVARMTAANELVRRAVVVDAIRRPAEHDPRPDPLGPSTSLVMRSSLTPAPAGASPEATVFGLADGFAYAIDGTSGAPLWQVPLGLASPFVPRVVTGEATALAFDARHNELIKLDATKGALIWRLALGEPAGDPPLVLGNQLFQVLPSGKILLIALDTGELQSTINLGRPLARTPAHDESGQHLYVLGRQDCLFILAREPVSCVSVVYLGHLDGSVPCSPVMMGRFLVIPENDSLADSRWHVLVVDDDGVKVKPVQGVEVSGWTWSKPTTSGSVVWATGDKGGYEAFSVGDYASKAPFRTVARLTANSSASGPAFALARSDRDLWVESGHSGRYELDAEHGKIAAKGSLAQPGPALAPIQSASRLVVMTFQDQETSGVALWGIDSETGVIAWKTIVAAPWSTPLASMSGSDDLVMLGRDGHEVRITPDRVAQGGFIVQVLSRPGDFTLPPGVRLRLEAGGKPLSVIAPHERSNVLWVQAPGTTGSWHTVGLPTVPAADPIAWGSGVLIPGLDSRAYLIDPLTGQSQAEPFVPKFDRDRQGTWYSPARLDKDTVVLADDVGRIIRLELTTAPIARLVGEVDRVLDRRIIAAPARAGNAVIVATADRHVRSLAARDLSPVGSWALEAPLAGQPIGIGETCFVMDRSGGVMAFGRDGQRAWSIQLDSEVIGAPVVLDQLVWFLTRAGKLHALALSNGQKCKQVELGALPTGGLLMAGKQEVVPAGKGVIRPVAALPPGENRP